MRDMSALWDRAYETIREQCFMTIVCEAFLGAVPIYEKDRTPEVNKGLMQYATESLADMGGYKVLESALASTTDHNAKSYLRSINQICMEAATGVADRIVEMHKDDDDEGIMDAANNIGMTDDEYSKFTEAAKRVSPDSLSQIINDKVLDTVRAEKEAYQKDADMEAEIKSALTETGEDKTTDDEPDMDMTDPMIAEPGTGDMPTEDEVVETAEESFRAYGRAMMGNGFRPEHATLFSSLQEMAMETLMYGKERKAALPVKTMSIITQRRTFPVFKSFKDASPMAALENLCLSAIDSMGTPDAPPDEDTHRKALMTASLIYTFFETLNTMNLYCPGLQEVRAVVDERISRNELQENDRVAFMNGMKGIVNSAMGTLRKANSIPEIDMVEGQLQAVREAASRAPGMESYVIQLNQQCQPVFQLADTRRKALGVKIAPATETEQEMRLRELDTVEFSSVAASRGPKSNVYSFRCIVDPAKFGQSTIAVESLDGRGVKVGQNLVRLRRNPETAAMDSYLQSVIGSSNLPKHDKRILVINRITGKTYDVK